MAGGVRRGVSGAGVLAAHTRGRRRRGRVREAVRTRTRTRTRAPDPLHSHTRAQALLHRCRPYTHAPRPPGQATEAEHPTSVQGINVGPDVEQGGAESCRDHSIKPRVLVAATSAACEAESRRHALPSRAQRPAVERKEQATHTGRQAAHFEGHRRHPRPRAVQLRIPCSEVLA